jgi:hypothetical protein
MFLNKSCFHLDILFYSGYHIKYQVEAVSQVLQSGGPPIALGHWEAVEVNTWIVQHSHYWETFAYSFTGTAAQSF